MDILLTAKMIRLVWTYLCPRASYCHLSPKAVQLQSLLECKTLTLQHKKQRKAKRFFASDWYSSAKNRLDANVGYFTKSLIEHFKQTVRNKRKIESNLVLPTSWYRKFL